MLKHVSTRWLSLERCIDRALKKLPSLKSYFQSEDFSDARFVRLKQAFSNPIIEPLLFFHSASIQLYTHFNKLLQRSEPTIHILHSEIVALAKKIATRIVKPQCIKDTEISNLDLDDEDIFKPPQSVFLGGMTKGKLDKLLNEGDISASVYSTFFTAAKSYFTESLRYILKKFPINNELLLNAVWVNVPNRIHVKWENVQYFYDRYDSLFDGIPIDKLFEEFSDYQTLADEDIGAEAWQAAKVVEEVEDDGTEVLHYRVDVLWWYIANLKLCGSSVVRFKHLTKVAEAVLVIPHSNAEEERLFSIVRKNKTDSRSSLSLDGTLSNILAMKLQYPESTTP